jgi:hypothetical protein
MPPRVEGDRQQRLKLDVLGAIYEHAPPPHKIVKWGYYSLSYKLLSLERCVLQSYKS